MTKVFFGCSMRGGHEQVSVETLRSIKDSIKALGYELVSEHQTQEGIIDQERTFTPTEIHDRDYKWLMEAEVGVFEISNPSLGVGGEISDLVHLRKPVLCLYNEGVEDVSAYVQGKEGSAFVNSPFEVHTYDSVEDAQRKINHFVETHCS